MPVLATSHIVLALVAMVAGLLVIRAGKGTRWHRRIGWVYVVSMVGLNVTALCIYRLTGRFGPFHVAAVLSLVTIVVGMRFAWRRKPVGRWIVLHAYWMCGSYVGLLAAAAAEVTTRVPRVPFWWMAAGTSILAVFLGIWVMVQRLPAALRRFDNAR